MFEAFPDAIYLADRESGILTDVNPAGEKLIGRDRDQIIGMSQAHLHPPQRDEESRRLFLKHAQMVATGEAMKFQVVHANGSIIPVEIVGRVIEVGGRDVLMGVFRDISGRVTTEEDLSANLALFEAINNTLTGFITGKKAEDVLYQLLEVMRSVTASEFGVIMELRKSEDEGKPRLESLAITEVPADGEDMGDGPSFTEFDHLVCSPVHRNTVVVENNLNDDTSYCGIPGCCIKLKNYMGLPIRQGDQIIGLIGMGNRPGGYDERMIRRLEPTLGACANIIIGARDRHQRKRERAELLKAKEAAEEATKLKDQFVSLIAHDLRSPFTSILGFMRMLEYDSKGKLDERQLATISSAINSGENLLEMIDNILDISRLKTGKLQVRSSFHDLRQLAVIAINAVSALAQEKGVRISNMAPEGSRIYADRGLYCSVLQNLLSNAIKFSSEGQEVVVFRPDGSRTELAVRDYGSGIKEAFIADLFRHEVKTTSVGTKGEKGTGLGLPYSADIMTAHGGRIWHCKGQERGSVFYTMIPFVRPRVVVVDDSPGIRALARVYLEDIDVEVIECEDGEEALFNIRNNPPHLVITDIYMPGVGGLDIIKAVREEKSTSHLPVIVVTSDAGMEVRERALRAGADDFTTKPLAPNEFIPRVRRFLA
ncbi:MAG: response regulator [Nitrospinota bacterium]|nr:response regulator [Nitrospinota bacterium]